MSIHSFIHYFFLFISFRFVSFHFTSIHSFVRFFLSVFHSFILCFFDSFFLSFHSIPVQSIPFHSIHFIHFISFLFFYFIHFVSFHFVSFHFAFGFLSFHFVSFRFISFLHWFRDSVFLHSLIHQFIGSLVHSVSFARLLPCHVSGISTTDAICWSLVYLTTSTLHCFCILKTLAGWKCSKRPPRHGPGTISLLLLIITTTIIVYHYFFYYYSYWGFHIMTKKYVNNHCMTPGSPAAVASSWLASKRSVKSPNFNYASKKKCLCHAVDLGKLMESARNMYVILCRFHLFSLFKAS